MRAPLVVLLALVGCSPRPEITVERAPVASASSSAPGALARASASAVPAPPPIKVTVRFELRMREGGVRALVAVAEPVAEREVALVPPEHRCLAYEGHQSRLSPGNVLQVGCGLTRVAQLRLSSGRIVLDRLDGSEPSLLVVSGGPIELLEDLVDPATPAGCDQEPTSARPIVATTVVRPAAPGDKEGSSLFLLIPSLGVDLRMGLWDQAYCHGSQDRGGQTFMTLCLRPDEWHSLHAQIRGDALLFHRLEDDIDLEQARALGGVRLPCGTRVRFPSVHHVGARYERSRTVCGEQCLQVKDLCWDRCRRMPVPFGDRQGLVWKCGASCEEAGWSCNQRC